jgi:two-component system response regulator HupR/HoxA
MQNESVLIVDDQVEILNSLRRLLRREFTVVTASSGSEAMAELEKDEFAVIISDQRMPEMDGVTFLSKSLDLQPLALRLLITGYADIDATIGAVNQAKVDHYIAKPFEPEDVLLLIRQSAEKYRQRRYEKEAREALLTEKQELQKHLQKELDLGNFIGGSAPVLAALKLARKVIDTPTTVLILGETGTGKELLARIIHFNSLRRDKMFVAQNCGAIPDTLLQSELFGHVKGSFTGAIKDKKGLFELADKGSIFLDEIGDTTPALQLGLLRALQEGEIKPLGSATSKKVDVRVIAATNRDLAKEVREGRFREDLFYRLSVFPIHLPALRERRDDIPDLAQYFIEKYAQRIGKRINGLTTAALNRLMQGAFPGNIRELENEIERMVTLAEDNQILDESLLSQKFMISAGAEAIVPISVTNLKNAIDYLEREMITKALRATNGNILRSAHDLGVSRVGLHKMLRRHNIKTEAFKARKE